MARLLAPVATLSVVALAVVASSATKVASEPSAGPSFAPTDCTVNGLAARDLDSASFPVDGGFVLSWQVQHNGTLAPSEGPTAFSVDLTGTLRSGKETTPLIWSSGKVESTLPIYILPQTLTSRFAPGASFEWKVRLHASAGQPTHAVAGSFDTSPSAAAWEAAEWIGGGSELRADMTLPAATHSAITRARAYATGVGAFELHLNGQKVGDHFMDPGEAVYDQKVLFLSFNVTSLLRPGANAVGARLGNSKFGYLDIYANRTALGDQSGDASRAFKLLLVVGFADGSEQTLVSSASSGGWKYRHGPIVYDHLWHGEIYDSRQELPGWSEKPLGEMPTWQAAKAMTPKVGGLYPQLMQPIRITKSFEPVATTLLNASSPGSWVTNNVSHGAGVIWDFGQNMAGLSTLTIDKHAVVQALRAAALSAAHTVIMLRLKHTEITNVDGSAFNNYYPGMEFGRASATCSMADWYDHKWYECANQTDAYIMEIPAAGAPVAVDASPVQYTQTFTYHGFRHLQLTATTLLPSGEEAPLSPQLSAAFPWSAFKAVAHRAHSDMPALTTLSVGEHGAGNLKDSSMLGKIFNATIASHLSNVWGIPTDCPQREKRGWMGDAGISSSSLQTFYDAYAVHANFLRLLVDNQRKGCWGQPTTTIYSACGSSHFNLSKNIAIFNGSVPDVTPFPTGPYGANPGSTDWQTAFPVIARNIHLHYGALAVPVLAEIYPSLQLFMDGYLERLVHSDPHGDTSGLLLQGARGDWVPPEGNHQGPQVNGGILDTPTASIAAFWHTLCVGYMAEIASAIGEMKDAARYTARLQANRKAYHARFFNGLAEPSAHANTTGKRCCYDKGSQTSNIMALQIGAVPEQFIKSTVAMLVASIRNSTAGSARVADDVLSTSETPQGPMTRRAQAGRAFDPTLPPHWLQDGAHQHGTPFGPGAHADVGIFGATYLFEVLHKHGHDAAGVDILTETSYPSFGHMIENTATTLWESWEGSPHKIEGGGTSRNHIMFGGGVNRFIQAGIGGLTIDTSLDQGELGGTSHSGWKRLLVHPSPRAMRTLGRASTSRRTPLGEAAVAWYVGAEGSVHMHTTVPYGATADVQLPLLLATSTIHTAVRRPERHVVVGGCVLRCLPSGDVSWGVGDTPGDATCDMSKFGATGVRWETRLDGEVVMVLAVPSGKHSFHVHND